MLLLIISFCLILQVFYWNILFSKLWKFEDRIVGNEKSAPISILVCAKNEMENLKELIPILKSQTVSEKEILILDDNSSDGSSEFVLSNFPNINIVSNPEKINGKKQTLYNGIEKANNQFILLTDADCQPPATWAQTMISALDQKEIVLGYSPYSKSQGFLNLWIRYEGALTAFQYFSAAIGGFPYMGVGRNLLYNKRLILDSKFKKHIDLASGDDDLTISQIANEQNTSICLDPKSWVYSDPPRSWLHYYKQKSRHYSTSHRYEPKIIVFLMLFSLSWIGFYLALFLLALGGNVLWILIFWWLRYGLSIYPITKLCNKFGIPDAIKYWPLLDFVSVLYFITFAVSTLPNKKQKW